MRTNIDIDDGLMAGAMKAGPYRTKKEAVEAGLKLLARQAAYREILKWAVGNAELALEAAQHDRSLRARGTTVRSGVDVLIAAFCIDRGYALLHRDRDFDAFDRVRGLRTWRH